jgi:outer membrane protein OmpA-like peptidoglycan-associated protein
MKTLNLFVFLFLLIFFPFFAAAEEVAFDSENTPTVEDVVSALKPDEAQDIKLRGINYKPEPAAPKMVSVMLEFEQNSYELTENTQKSLNMVGQALNSDDLKDLTFTLEGHADASGTEEYNLELSQKRAESVKQYLEKKYQVNPDRLNVVGKGETELLEPENPGSEKNRRVRIITHQ